MTYKSYCPNSQRAIVNYTFPGKRERTYEAETAPILVEVSKDFGEDVIVPDVASSITYENLGWVYQTAVAAIRFVPAVRGVRSLYGELPSDSETFYQVQYLSCEGIWLNTFTPLVNRLESLKQYTRFTTPTFPECKPVPPWNIRIKDSNGKLLFDDSGKDEPLVKVECECPKIDYRLKIEAYPGHECLPVQEFSRRLKKARQDYENK